MSIRTVKVCEECGKQTMNGDAWLVMSDIEIRTAGLRENLVSSKIDLDFCSPGCLLRFVSRSLEIAQGRHPICRHGDVEKMTIAVTRAA